MKTKYFKSIIVIIAFVMILVSFGTSRVIATTHHQEANGPSKLDPVDIEDELTIIIPSTYEPNGQWIEGEDDNTLTATQYRYVFQADNAKVWNSYYNPQVVPAPERHGCQAFRSDTAGESVDIIFPVILPPGTKITGIWWTGWDGYITDEIRISLERKRWDGLEAQFMVADGSGKDFADQTHPFNRHIDVNYTIPARDWSHYIKLRIPADVKADYGKFSNACQVTIDYIPPSIFGNAFPTIMTKP